MAPALPHLPKLHLQLKLKQLHLLQHRLLQKPKRLPQHLQHLLLRLLRQKHPRKKSVLRQMQESLPAALFCAH